MNEPDIVQKLSVDFNVINNMSADFTMSPSFSASFGSVYVISGDCRVLYASTETWNSRPQLVSERGYIYIYSDYRQNEQEQNIPAMKVGDGSAYLIDLPFADDLIQKHIADNIIHITQGEREFWNNKVRCFIDPLDGHNLVFTTD